MHFHGYYILNVGVQAKSETSSLRASEQHVRVESQEHGCSETCLRRAQRQREGFVETETISAGRK